MANDLFNFSECEKILAAHSGGQLILKDFKIMPAIEAVGYLGEYYRLVMNCMEAQTTKFIELKFFIKSIPRNSDEVEKVAIFKKEANLYGTLLKELQGYTTTVWCPNAFYTRNDLIVLDDLCSLGYEKLTQKSKGLNDFEMKAILNATAALHAATIIYEIKNDIKIDKNYPAEILNEITISPEITWYTIGLQTIMELAQHLPKFQSQESQDFIKNELKQSLDRAYEMNQTSKKYQNVVCHRDLWYANIMFNYTTKNAVLVDYQTCRYCPPAIDVLFALFLNLDIETRKSKEFIYLEWYYERFRYELLQHQINVNNNNQLSYKEFLKSYEDLKLLGFVYRALAFTLLKVPTEFVTNDYKYMNRSRKLLNYMKINEEFRYLMENCIEEILNYILGEK